ncbi:MAG: sigma-E factor negative regulatory protein [Rubrivivax sp.]
MDPEPPLDAHDPRWLMSALVDGELDAADCGRVCAAWAEASSEARSGWHAYHLIGDVLRSDDLASPPGHDQAFLERLHARLAEEPAVLAPTPMPIAAAATVRRSGRAAWAMPAAMAAGVAALAVGVVLTLDSGAGAGGATPVLAASQVAATIAAAPGQPQPAPVLEASAQGSRIVRDAQLDRYLRAHREYGAALPGSLPGGSARSITTVSLDR